MGAIVSYELALHLQKNNWPIPSLLFVSACRAPHLEDDEPPLHTLARDEFIKRLETLNGTPKEVLNNHELLELMLPVLRADFAVCETYNNQDVYRLNSPIRAFGGQEDPKVLLEHLEAWGEHTRSSFSVRMFPGDHFYLHSNESLLLQDISAELDYRLKVSA
jgi:medium-chain acyl-[acyl-carrier-protein] hydrolase